MEPIRQLHDNFQPQSKLIIFCDGKILYDHDKKTYCFEPKDLNTLDSYSPFLSIAKDTLLDEYYYSIEIAPNTDILGIFIDPAQKLNLLILEQHYHLLIHLILSLYQELQFL